MRRALGLLALVGALAVAALCVRLGLWQASRWQEKRALAAVIAERLAAPVSDLASVSVLDAGLEGRRVRVQGVFEDSSHVLLAGRIELGEPGVGLVSVLALRDGGRVLVDRGWVPAPDAREADPRAYAHPGPVSLLAVLRPLPEAPRDAQWLRLEGDDPVRWSVGRLTVEGARARLGRSLAPYWLIALPESGGARLPKRLEPVLPDAGMHLSYAFQWFLFAAGTLAAAGFVVWRERGRPGSGAR